MNGELLKLTTYFGERDRAGGRFLADALLEVFERRGLATSVLVRGVEGFGLKHHLHTQRLLTLSEDLPLVSVAVDSPQRIEASLDDVVGLHREGLVTLERARTPAAAGAHEETKLTVYCGRLERAGGRPAHLAIVDLLQRGGVAGATVLLGVDGIVGGERRRARFFSRNADVPLMILSVGEASRVAAVVRRLDELVERPVATLERVTVLKRDGCRLAELPPAPDGMSQKLTVYVSEAARDGRHPAYVALIHALRREGAAGATALRGIWGYHGDHPAHGDRLLALRRHSPIVLVVVDSPARCRRWFDLIDGGTAASGLVTSEFVPALRASPGDSLALS